jgi:HK97 family phage major capsid protein
MSKLIQMAEEITAKRQSLADIFEKHTVNGELDMPMAVVEDVRSKNEELTDLSKKYEQALEADRIANENKSALEKLEREPVGSVRFPSNGNGQGDERVVKTIGELFAESKEYKTHVGQHNGENKYKVDFPTVDFKTLMTTTAGFPPESTRSGDVVPSAQRQVVFTDILPSRSTTQNSYVFMEETTFTNNAAERNEGAALAESALAFTERTSPVRSIGTFIPVTEEQLDDVVGIQAIVNNDLLLMYRLREESQLLVGDGNAPNLTGFLNTGSIQTQAKGADVVPDAVHKAITKVRVTGRARPTHVVMHPNDWQDIRLLRTAEGVYIWGSPSDSGPERIWGLPIVVTDAITENTALVGDFFGYSYLVRRQGATIEVGLINDDFQKLRKSIRIAGRVGLVVRRPQAFCTVTSI